MTTAVLGCTRGLRSLSRMPHLPGGRVLRTTPAADDQEAHADGNGDGGAAESLRSSALYQ